MTWTLPRIVGLVRARKVILTDQIIDAPEALELGLLTEIVDDDRVDASAREIAVALASGPAAALQATAALLRADPATTLVEQLAAEAASISSLGRPGGGIEVSTPSSVAQARLALTPTEPKSASSGLTASPVDRFGAQPDQRVVGPAERPRSEEPARRRERRRVR